MNLLIHILGQMIFVDDWTKTFDAVLSESAIEANKCLLRGDLILMDFGPIL